MLVKLLVLIASVIAGFTLLYKPSPSSRTVYDLEFKGDNEVPAVKLSEFKGKAVLVVNTASECSFTYQYEHLQQLYEKYKDDGLIVLGVPSNDFGGQEPLSDAGINQFCSSKFHVTFPMAKKVSLSDSEFYNFVSSKEGLGPLAKPRWNFWKILIGKDGKAVNWFTTITSPVSSRVTEAIEQELRS